MKDVKITVLGMGDTPFTPSPMLIHEIRNLDVYAYRDEAWSERRVSYLLDSGVVIEARTTSNEYLVGALHGRFFPSYSTIAFYVNSLVVHPEYQHRSIGRSLMNMLEEFCRSFSVKFIVLNCRAEVEEFYRKLGFTCAEPKDHVWIKEIF